MFVITLNDKFRKRKEILNGKFMLHDAYKTFIYINFHFMYHFATKNIPCAVMNHNIFGIYLER
jgi:hypothetical protein